VRRGIPERGDIVHLDLDPTLGTEQRGARPVLVLTTEPFNRMGLVLAAPITQGGKFARDAGFAASLTGSGTQTQGVILAHQIRMLDWRARHAKFLERAPEDLTADVLARVSALLE
jgi:mRNA interferase ChpB